MGFDLQVYGSARKQNFISRVPAHIKFWLTHQVRSALEVLALFAEGNSL